jgi:peptide/nickel transport system permease protein
LEVDTSHSLWSKIRSKSTLIWGVVTICCLSLIALFAYIIIPDKSNDANNQLPEIPLKHAGYSINVFDLNGAEESAFDFKALFLGNTDVSNGVAFDSLAVFQDKITFYTPIGTQRIVSIPESFNERQWIKTNTKQRTFWLGTDKYGRDILSRLILGIRISLLAGLMAVLVSLIIGLFLGSIAGYYRGWIDQMIMFLINVTWSIPTILLVFAIVLAFGRGLGVIFLAVGLTMWVDVARIVRGQVISVKEEQFVLAAESVGQSSILILLKHILPNISGPVLVIVAANFATAILIEAGLSYLGFGVNPPTPSLGNMLNENYGYALSGNLMIAVLPALVIMILVLSFNLIGSGLRDVFDVKDTST